MSAESPKAPPAAPEPKAVRIVLFGMPDAGKSSLLGALFQTAHSQGRALHGHLTDLSHGLGELRNRLYEERQTETQEEIVPYPVRFAPYGQAGFPAVLYDCDGRTANDYLVRKRALEKEARPGTLAGAVLSADVLILAVDASAPHDQIADDFREFRRFLGHLEQYRQREHAVGGLPVYLVLTKADLLARDTISRSMWEARIAEKKKEVARLFQQYLAGSGNLLAFGTLNLEVRATAVRRPALTDAAAQPKEPYGVAELFHEAFVDALAFRSRSRRSHKRLLWTVGGAGGFLGLMLSAGLLFLATAPAPTGPTLADRVEMLRAAEGRTAAARLGDRLDRRLREWQAVLSDPGFADLSEPLQTFVRGRLDEGQAYVRFREALASIPSPTRAQTLAELNQVEQRLTRLEPPPAYRDEWAETPAVRERARLLTTEVPALKEAVGQLTQYYFALANRARDLLLTSELNAEWAQRVQALEESGKTVPFSRSDPVRGAAYDYADVEAARIEWQQAHDRLTRLHNLAGALGLLGGDPERAPLALPPLPPEAEVPATGTRRWQALQSLYPTFRTWSLDQVPDAVRPEAERRLARSVEQGALDTRRLILDKVKGLNLSGKEEPADWPRVGEYLLSPAVADWRNLVAYLNRLLNPSAADPIEQTAAFLRQDAFEIDPRRVQVRLPDTLSNAPVRPAGDLALVHRPPGGESQRLTLRPQGEPRREKQSLVYTFVAGGPGFSYRPGDAFHAELPVKVGDRSRQLTWASPRTLSFQFGALQGEPRLHAPDQSNVEGVAAVGVDAMVVEGKFPQVPAMVPAVRFGK